MPEPGGERSDVIDRENWGKLIAAASVGILVVDRDTARIVGTNEAMASMLGYERRELLQLSIDRVKVLFESGTRWDEYIAILRARGPEPVESDFRRKDGTVLPLEINATFVEELRRVILVGHDVAARRQVEDSLRLHTEILRHMVESVHLVRADDGTIVYANPGFETMFGYMPSEILGRHVSTLNAPTDRSPEETAREIMDALRREGSWRGEVHNIRKDGTTFWCEATVTHYGDPQYGDVWISVHQDITQHRQMQREMRKMQTLESIGLLAGGIAHDLNNFLTVITGNIGLARSLDDAEERAALLGVVEQEASRIKRLTGQLLTFAKGGAPVTELVDLSPLLMHAAEFALSGTQVRPSYAIDEGDFPVEADPVQIEQVITNVIINARQAMPDGGSIRISLTRPAPSRGQRRMARIEIRDSGVGIPADEVARVFDPFFTTRAEGTGLGLAVAQSIVEQHNGKITVTSEEGSGTSIVVDLPLASGTPESAGSEKSVEASGDARRVLVMDDQVEILSIYERALGLAGFRVDACTDGADAVARYRRAMESGAPFDIVILDLTVPGAMGGKEALEELRELDPGSRVIVASGYSDDDVLARHEDYGIDGILAKPFTLAQLNNEVARVLEMDA